MDHAIKTIRGHVLQKIIYIFFCLYLYFVIIARIKYINIFKTEMYLKIKTA